MKHSDTKAEASAPPPRRSSQIWMGLSFALTAIILGWAFTAPLRGSMAMIGSAKRLSDIQKDFSVTAEQKRIQAEDFRDNAILQHHDYLRGLKRQRRAHTQKDLPGTEEADQRWQERVKSVRAEVRQLDALIDKSENDVAEDSMLWQDREHLKKTLQDGAE